MLSSPSGGGKTTLAQAVMACTPGITRSITYTTRPRRFGEEDGRDYHFLTPPEFERHRRDGEFLEWATIHGYLYGTSRADISRLLAQGLDVLLVIDHQGAASLRQQHVDAVYIFILPPSWAALEQRLGQRDSDNETVMRARLAIAPMEMAQYERYDYVVVNDDLGSATQQLQAIIVADRCRVERLDRRYGIFAELDEWRHERDTTA